MEYLIVYNRRIIHWIIFSQSNYHSKFKFSNCAKQITRATYIVHYHSICINLNLKFLFSLLFLYFANVSNWNNVKVRIKKCQKEWVGIKHLKWIETINISTKKISTFITFRSKLRLKELAMTIYYWESNSENIIYNSGNVCTNIILCIYQIIAVNELNSAIIIQLFDFD